MKELTINSKKYGTLITFIDDEDYDKVKEFGNWQVTKNRNKFYVQKRINKKIVYLHRFLLDFPKGYVDHINNNSLDNRKSNLRITTNADNLRNGSLRNNNSSGIKGVYFDKSRNKYTAEIKVNYKKIFLGRYNTLEEATTRRKQAEKEYFETKKEGM